METQDHYSILGVEKDARVSDIRKAYKKLVLKWHPDKNPNNPKAATQFRAVSEAYRVLSNQEERYMYDKFVLRSPFADQNFYPSPSKRRPSDQQQQKQEDVNASPQTRTQTQTKSQTQGFNSPAQDSSFYHQEESSFFYQEEEPNFYQENSRYDRAPPGQGQKQRWEREPKSWQQRGQYGRDQPHEWEWQQQGQQGQRYDRREQQRQYNGYEEREWGQQQGQAYYQEQYGEHGHGYRDPREEGDKRWEQYHREWGSPHDPQDESRQRGWRHDGSDQQQWQQNQHQQQRQQQQQQWQHQQQQWQQPQQKQQQQRQQQQQQQQQQRDRWQESQSHHFSYRDKGHSQKGRNFGGAENSWGLFPENNNDGGDSDDGGDPNDDQDKKDRKYGADSDTFYSWGPGAGSSRKERVWPEQVPKQEPAQGHQGAENRGRQDQEQQTRERQRQAQERQRQAQERQRQADEAQKQQERKAQAQDRQAQERGQGRQAQERQGQDHQAQEREAQERQAQERQAQERQARERQTQERQAREQAQQAQDHQAQDQKQKERQAQETKEQQHVHSQKQVHGQRRAEEQPRQETHDRQAQEGDPNRENGRKVHASAIPAADGSDGSRADNGRESDDSDSDVPLPQLAPEPKATPSVATATSTTTTASSSLNSLWSSLPSFATLKASTLRRGDLRAAPKQEPAVPTAAETVYHKLPGSRVLLCGKLDLQLLQRLMTGSGGRGPLLGVLSLAPEHLLDHTAQVASAALPEGLPHKFLSLSLSLAPGDQLSKEAEEKALSGLLELTCAAIGQLLGRAQGGEGVVMLHCPSLDTTPHPSTPTQTQGEEEMTASLVTAVVIAQLHREQRWDLLAAWTSLFLATQNAPLTAAHVRALHRWAYSRLDRNMATMCFSFHDAKRKFQLWYTRKLLVCKTDAARRGIPGDGLAGKIQSMSTTFKQKLQLEAEQNPEEGLSDAQLDDLVDDSRAAQKRYASIDPTL